MSTQGPDAIVTVDLPQWPLQIAKQTLAFTQSEQYLQRVLQSAAHAGRCFELFGATTAQVAKKQGCRDRVEICIQVSRLGIVLSACDITSLQTPACKSKDLTAEVNWLEPLTTLIHDLPSGCL